MADLNYIVAGGVKYYPLDKEARADITEIKEALKQIGDTGNATSWEELLNKPFYEISEVKTLTLFDDKPSWVEDAFPYTNITVSTAGSGEYVLNIGGVNYTPVFNSSVTLGDYQVQLNADNLYMEYQGSGTPATSVKLTETLTVTTLKKLDRKFIDMGYKLERYAFTSFASNKEVTVNGIWDKVKNKDFVFVETTDGTVGKLELMEYTASKRKFYFEFTDPASSVGYVYVYGLTVTSANKVKLDHRLTLYASSTPSATEQDKTITAVLVPDYDVEVI